MKRTAGLVLGCLSLLFVLYPLAVPINGLPVTLKGDEPAYYLTALSIARDGDLLCETRDLHRLFDAFPHLPVENVILMSMDGWRTIYFGKPIIYSTLAAPFAALFGSRGMVAFNMVMFVGMIWMGYFYLRRSNPEGLAAFFAASFFLVSVGFAYVFWLHTEVLNMFAIMASLYLAATEENRAGSRALSRIFGGWARPVWSGAALSLAVYNKPMLVAMAIPALYMFARRRGAKAAVPWLAALALALAAQAGFALAATGTPTPYLGTSRVGFRIEDPDKLAQVVEPFQNPVVVNEGTSSWHWLARVPDLFPGMLAENAGYFLVGRHTGLFIYMPFSLVCLILFLLHDRRSVFRWLLVGCLAGVAVFFLVWVYFNWHGGGGFIGNRYFVNLYPAFLFLVPRIRPTWLLAAGYVLGGLFLTPIVFFDYGLPVPFPTLQAHVRGAAFQLLPQELSIASQVPGYSNFGTRGVSIRGRKDQFQIGNRGAALFRLRGAETAELWISSAVPIKALELAVSSLAPTNRISFSLGSEHREVVFDDTSQGSQLVILAPKRATKVRYQLDKRVFAYRLVVRSETGRNPRHPNGNRDRASVLRRRRDHCRTHREGSSRVVRPGWPVSTGGCRGSRLARLRSGDSRSGSRTRIHSDQLECPASRCSRVPRAQAVGDPFPRRARERAQVYERAYTTSPDTLAAHVSLLSGLYPAEHPGGGAERYAFGWRFGSTGDAW